MAVFKIFPTQDSTLYSRDFTTNTGLDEILEVGAYNLSNQTPASTTILGQLGLDDIRRSLIQFDTADIRAAIGNYTGSLTSSLRLYLANADNLTQRYSVYAYPIAQSWENGLGKYQDAPTNTLGCSWKFRSAANLGIEWSTNNGAVTSSLFTKGGGSWTTPSESIQEFGFTSNKDVNMNVSQIVNSWTASFSAQQNNGFIVKLSDSIELDSGSYMGLKFYSRETHTIYPPALELKWDDSSFNTGSQPPFLAQPSSSISQSFVNIVSASVITSVVTQSFTTNFTPNVISEDSFVLVVNNNLGSYKGISKYTFRVKGRDLFPVRQFTTSSVYLNWKYLPTSSYWGIQDYKTKEMVVDFDKQNTKLSVDQNGNYFTVYMHGLEPERSYKLLIQTELVTGEVITKDQDIIFKVER